MLKPEDINPKLTKPEEMTSPNSTKLENTSKFDTSLKKLYLPTIQKKTIQTVQISSVNRGLIKSKSQAFLTANNKTFDNSNPNAEKEKLMLAKLTLSRVIGKINDIKLNYKKLLVEKGENLGIINEAISMNDPSNIEVINLKIEQMLEESLKKNGKYILTTNNYESRFTDERNNKSLETKDNNNKSITKEENDTLNIKENPDKDNDNQNNNINEENKNIEENNNKENKVEETKKDEENNNKDENNNNDDINKENNKIENNEENNENNNINNQETKKHDYSMETREEDINKFNSGNNSQILNNNNNSGMINSNKNNNSEDLIKTIEEKEEDKENIFPIENGIFEKSSVPTKLFTVLKVKSQLSSLKHQIINIQQKIKLKDEEIEEIRSRAKMKNIIFQSNILDSKMVALHRIKTKNREIEEISLPQKNILRENLKKELDYYTKIKEEFINDNKGVGENYLKIKNEYEQKNKVFSHLQEKNNNLKYKYNSLRLNDIKKNTQLQNMKNRISQIDNIKKEIEINKQKIEDKKKEIEENKKTLEQKKEEYDISKGNKDTKYNEMNKLQKETNYKISKQKNEFNKIKKEMKDMDKLIYREIENYHLLNKNNKDLVNQMYINKNKTPSEFMEYLNQMENSLNIKFEEDKINRFKTLKSGGKMNYEQISKIERKNSKADNKSIGTESLQTLNEKLEYFLNNDKDEKKN